MSPKAAAERILELDKWVGTTDIAYPIAFNEKGHLASQIALPYLEAIKLLEKILPMVIISGNRRTIGQLETFLKEHEGSNDKEAT